MKWIQIQWTSPSESEAVQVVHHLLKQKLIACANLTPVHSYFFWEGNLDQAQEIKVFMKTAQKYFEVIEQEIKKMTQYKVPEILYFEIQGGNLDYINWMKETLL